MCYIQGFRNIVMYARGCLTKCRKGTVLFLLDVAPMPRYSTNVIFSGPLRKVPAETLNPKRVRLAAPCKEFGFQLLSCMSPIYDFHPGDPQETLKQTA